MSKIPADTQKRISPEFQKRLLELLDDKECTKNEFANAAGISKEVVARITIYGIIPTVRTLIKLADYFDVSLLYLLAESDDTYFYKSENPKTFQERLQELIAENHTKYSQIAHKMPFSKNFFYEWERVGTIPSLEYLQALAEYFNVSPDYLLGRTDDRN